MFLSLRVWRGVFCFVYVALIGTLFVLSVTTSLLDERMVLRDEKQVYLAILLFVPLVLAAFEKIEYSWRVRPQVFLFGYLAIIGTLFLLSARKGLEDKTIYLALLLFLPLAFRRIQEMELPIAGGIAKFKFQEMRNQIKEQARQIGEISNKAEMAISSLVGLHVTPKLVQEHFYRLRAEERINEEKTVLVGCQEFTEQRLLCAMATILVRKRYPELTVIPRYNYGGSALNFLGLLRAQIDIYMVYTWTGFEMSLGSSLKYIRPPLLKRTAEQMIGDPEEKNSLNHLYRDCPEPLTWLQPLGFHDDWQMVMLSDKADKIRNLSQLNKHAADLVLGCEHEFFTREAGYGALNLPRPHGYGLRFKEVKFYRHAEVYDALLQGEVDVIDAFSTDPRIDDKARFRTIVDDENLFGKYHAVPLVRAALVDKYRNIKHDLSRLKIGQPDIKEMIRRADAVTGQAHLDNVESVAMDYLTQKGFLEIVVPSNKEKRQPLDW